MGRPDVLEVEDKLSSGDFNPIAGKDISGAQAIGKFVEKGENANGERMLVFLGSNELMAIKRIRE